MILVMITVVLMIYMMITRSSSFPAFFSFIARFRSSSIFFLKMEIFIICLWWGNDMKIWGLNWWWTSDSMLKVVMKSPPCFIPGLDRLWLALGGLDGLVVHPPSHPRPCLLRFWLWRWGWLLLGHLGGCMLSHDSALQDFHHSTGHGHGLIGSFCIV